MRARLAELLVERAKKDPDAYVLSGDHGYALFDRLRKARPSQFINVGVAEQAMIGLAAGMAKGGLRPIVYGLASFIPIRVLEFIKMDICYQSLPVILLGDGAGLVYSTLGASHQCGEDLATLQPLPNIRLYSPADATELEYCFETSVADAAGASYIRLGKSDRPPVHTSSRPDIREGCVALFDTPRRVTVFATGSMVSTALELAKEFPLGVVSVPGLSHLTAERVEHLTRGSEWILSIEEHSTYGGLGSLINQYAVESGHPRRVRNFGLKRQFTSLASTYEVALSEHGLTLAQLRTELSRMF